MDTRASDRCAVMSESELTSLIDRVKARMGPQDLASRVDALATKYHDQLSQLRARTAPMELSNPSASTIVFHAFLSDMTQLHTNFSTESMGGCHTVEEQAQCTWLVDRAWSALMHSECFDKVGPIAEWLEEWALFVVSALMYLSRCVPPVDVCAENGLNQQVVGRLELYLQGTSRRSDVLGLPRSHPMNSTDDMDDDDDYDAQLSVINRRRRKHYEHMSQDSPTACDFVNGCAAVCQMLVALGVIKHTGSQVRSAIHRAASDSADAHKGQWATARLESTAYDVRLATATFEALLADDKETVDCQTVGMLAEYAERTVYQRFAELRTSELFGIIIDYPDSRGAISDLRMCVSRLRNMRQVAVALRHAVQRRLLHPGATTGDILTQYISAIRCLRLLDPSSTVLEIVARPIRAYLRSRADTVSCIVQDMVSEESELFEDLANGGQQQLLIADPEGIVYDEEYAEAHWEPLPVEAKTVYRSAQRRDADVLSLLVTIYDTKDVFVREFETYLENQLLEQAGSADYATDREIKQVEMMKLRFGDAALARCEVMLKDIADSKRIAQNVVEASGSQGMMPLHATVVSRQFWSPQPPGEEQFAMPADMADLVDKYASVYRLLKPARTLEWRTAQSYVSLDVELADRTLELTVRPAHAAVLFAFQEQGTLALGDLARILECTEGFVLPRVRFWQARGVVRETAPNTFAVVETEAPDAPLDTLAAGVTDRTESVAGAKHVDEDEEEEEEEGEEGQAASLSDARTEALRMNFKYIVGMLTNLGPLPLDRITSMLSMFVPGATTTAEEMRDFLAQMVREDKLEMAGGMYKLKQ